MIVAAGADRRLRRRERLGRSDGIGELVRNCLRWNGSELRVRWRVNTTDCDRLVIVVSRRQGGSVERNRTKRALREIFRCNKDPREPHLDVMLMPRQMVPEVSPSVLKEQFLQWQRGCARS